MLHMAHVKYEETERVIFTNYKMTLIF